MLNGRSLWNISDPTDWRHASNMNFVNFTTDTINVAEYIYPSRTPGVTDGFFLIMLSEVLCFVSFWHLHYCCFVWASSSLLECFAGSC